MFYIDFGFLQNIILGLGCSLVVEHSPNMCKAVVGSSPTLKKNRAHAMYFDR
jgi:hypothetical protein